MYSVYNGPFPEEVPWKPFYDTLITQLGITGARGFDLQTCEFNPAPGEYDIDAIRTEMVRKQYLHHVADSLGEIFRELSCVRTPAPWMKRNNSCTSESFSTWRTDSSNSLKPEHYDDFGAMCSAFVRIALDTFGIPIYGFSFQNEPEYNTPYPSCVYRNPDHWIDMLTVAGPALKRANPAILIYGCENVVTQSYPAWERAMVRDEQAAVLVDRFGVHGNARTTEVDTNMWPVYRVNHGRDVWHSEYNWQVTNYDSCFGLAAGLVHILGDGGNIRGYLAGGGKILWEDAGNFGGGVGGRKTYGYYFNAQVLRFVRPGMTRVKASSDVPLLRVIAFKNDARGSFSVVLLNGTEQDLEVTLTSTGTIPDSLEMRTTSSELKFVEGDVQNGRSAVTVPSRGVVSLGFRIRGPQPIELQTIKGWHAATSMPRQRMVPGAPVHLFDLRGRTVGRGAASARGARMTTSVVVQRDARGRSSVTVRGVPTLR